MARVWSSVTQSHGSPLAEQIPWPYWVILIAVQLNSGSAAIRPATTLVLPTLRECPPTTTNAMWLFSHGREQSALSIQHSAFSQVQSRSCPRGEAGTEKAFSHEFARINTNRKSKLENFLLVFLPYSFVFIRVHSRKFVANVFLVSLQTLAWLNAEC